ncbi:hypothetical protein [Pectobacterium carotovorum]|uniref:Up-regulated in Daf-2 domain-containing protein n=1 Tax=Pectobacterium carotovorum TaxID=554 RepID=A0A419AYH7_PECCA|nr:hypothetical protein [Pectobacterium carotovorum]RJL52903.1 hypothetical protein D5071_06685 [Pectobacterium carotovorum]
MTTVHTGYINFKNNWGENISWITIRHRRRNNPNYQEQENFRNIIAGEKRENIMTFKYETGKGSPFDYWWIKFITESGRLYTIKNDFYCSVTRNDDGNVYLSVDGNKKKMYVAFSRSSSCSVSIRQE